MCRVPKQHASGGRPRRRAASAAAPRQSISFDAETNTWLERIAQEEERSVSYIVRHCVRYVRKIAERDRSGAFFLPGAARTTRSS
jgi:hypothetical protein